MDLSKQQYSYEKQEVLRPSHPSIVVKYYTSVSLTWAVVAMYYMST